MVPEAVLQALMRFATAEGVEVYLVGGYVRDRLLGRQRTPLNIDLAVPSGAIERARRWAAALDGAFVLLHETFGSARIVLRDGVEVDVTDFRGATIADDLRGRDFTVNALALPLATLASVGDAWRPDDLLDPLDGRDDLRWRRLRLCHPAALADDPARLLRGIALAAACGFTIEPETEAAMRATAPLLRHVAMERAAEPCWALLAQPAAAPWLERMASWGILEIVLPEVMAGRGVTQGGYHHLDVLAHQIEACRQLEDLLRDPATLVAERHRPALAAYLAEPLASSHPRAVVMKWAALLHDIGKPSSRRVDDDGRVWFTGHEMTGSRMVEQIGERWRFARREGEAIATIVRHHLRPGQLARLRREATTGRMPSPQPTPRAIFRFFRDVGAEGPATLIVWLADRLATRGPEADEAALPSDTALIHELLGRYLDQASEAVGPPRLLDGRRLMAHLGIGPGPTVGRLLEAIAEAQVEGSVRTPEEALALAEQIFRRVE